MKKNLHGIEDAERLHIFHKDVSHTIGFETGYLCAMLVGCRYLDGMKKYALNNAHQVSEECLDNLSTCASELGFEMVRDLKYKGCAGYASVIFKELL